MPRHMVWLIATIIIIFICGIIMYLQPQQVEAPAAEQTIAELATNTPEQAPATEIGSAPTIPISTSIHVGPIDLSGLDETQVRSTLQNELPEFIQPVVLEIGTTTYTIQPTDIGLTITLDSIIEDIQSQPATTQPISVPINLEYNQADLQQQLNTIIQAQSITASLAYSPTLAAFIEYPGQTIDEASAYQTVITALAKQEYRIRLEVQPITSIEPPTLEQLTSALKERETEWDDGLIGVAITDLQTGETYGYHHDTIFSGMSILKIGILLQAYIQKPTFSNAEYIWIDLMTRMSNNWAANRLLEIAGEGDGLEGVQRMNRTFTDVLNLEHTRMTAPFESITYLQEQLGLDFPLAGPEGPEPYTDADPYIRTTPSEVNRLIQAIVECSKGSGPLLKIRASNLSAARCEEMLYIMSRNRDINKLVSGVPRTAFVAHKSGWIEDARADAGYIRTRNGIEYIASVWIWSPSGYIETSVSDDILSDLSRIMYTSLEPMVITP